MVGKIIDIYHSEFAYLGLKMAIHDPEEDFPVSSVLDRTGAWEAFLTKQMISLLGEFESPAFYDVGANIGWYSLILAGQLQRTGRRGQIFSVEPSTRNRERLANSVALNGQEDLIQIVAGAASDRNGAISLELDLVNFGNHRVTGGAEHGNAVESVTAYCLDDLVDTNGWPLPSLIKVDVQGHEMEALRGFGRSLSRSGSWVMAIEWMPDEWSLSDMVAMLGADGVYQVDEQSRSILPSSEAHLLSLLPTWPSSYFDLLLTCGDAADKAVRALKDFEDRIRVRFVKGAGALLQNDRRRVSDGALALIEPLQGALSGMEVRISVKVLWTPGKTTVRFRAKGSDGRETSVVARQGEIAEISLTVGSGPARLGIRLVGSAAHDAQATVVLGPIEIVDVGRRRL